MALPYVFTFFSASKIMKKKWNMQNKMVLYSKYSIALWRCKVWAVEFLETIG